MRKNFRKIAGISAGWVPQGILTRLSRQNFIFPYYHAVSDEPLNHIRHVYSCRNPSRFIRDLEYLLRHFHAADLDALKAWQEDPASLKQPCFFLSFDDGLREAYEIIAPLLLKKGIPAAFFLNTEFIDNRELFFRYKISLILDRLESIRYSPAVTEILQSRFHLEGKERNHIRKFIQGIPYGKRSVLEEIAGLLDLDFGAFLRVKKPYMSTVQARELAGKGFYLGAHSKDHPDFGGLDMDAQLAQFRESLDYVKQEFSQKNGLFSFPFSDDGISKEFFENIRKSGEVLATFGTAGLKNDPIPFHHQRIPMEDLGLPAGMTLKGEYMYYLAKAPFGKNTMRR